MFMVIRVQARIRGLIFRKKVKTLRSNPRFFPNESNAKYVVSNSNKIVSKFFYIIKDL